MKMRPDGFVRVDDLLQLANFKSKGFTLQEVQAVVAANDKQRFTLQDESGNLYIRANQGHSLEVSVCA